MKRAAVFALMGPALFFAVFLICRGEPDGFVDVVILTFFLTFPVSVVSGGGDGYLARTLPFYLLFRQWILMRSQWMRFAAGGALCMGTCSLFSNKYFR